MAMVFALFAYTQRTDACVASAHTSSTGTKHTYDSRDKIITLFKSVESLCVCCKLVEVQLFNLNHSCEIQMSIFYLKLKIRVCATVQFWTKTTSRKPHTHYNFNCTVCRAVVWMWSNLFAIREIQWKMGSHFLFPLGGKRLIITNCIQHAPLTVNIAISTENSLVTAAKIIPPMPELNIHCENEFNPYLWPISMSNFAAKTNKPNENEVLIRSQRPEKAYITHRTKISQSTTICTE